VKKEATRESRLSCWFRLLRHQLPHHQLLLPLRQQLNRVTSELLQ
jgi:hypothetical protein